MMSYFKLLCLATPGGIGGYLYESFKQQCLIDILPVKAYCDISVPDNRAFRIEDLLPEPEPIEPEPMNYNEMDELDILEAIEDWNFDLEEEENHEEEHYENSEITDEDWENANIWGDITMPEDMLDNSDVAPEYRDEFDDLMYGLSENDGHIDVYPNLQNVCDDFGDNENNIFLLEGAEFDNAVNQAFAAEGNGQCTEYVDAEDKQRNVVVGCANSDWLLYGDVLVEYDRPTRLVYQTTEFLTPENVNETEHRHCEFLRVTPEVPEGEKLQASHEAWRGTDNRFDVAYLPQIGAEQDECNKADVASAREEPKDCFYCQESSLWNVFHQYYKFLVERCNQVTVCSGRMFTPEPHENMELVPINGDMVPAATHFYKIILATEKDGTQRLECYKFKTGPFTVERPTLRHYIVTRDELERDTGSPKYRHIHPINATETHSDFVPK